MAEISQLDGQGRRIVYSNIIVARRESVHQSKSRELAAAAVRLIGTSDGDVLLVAFWTAVAL